MRLEDEISDDRYQVRAKLPGIDPGSDVDVTTRDGQLAITADRARRWTSAGGRNSATAPSPGQFPCPTAPSRTASPPRTTTASSPSQCRCRTRQPQPMRTQRCGSDAASVLAGAEVNDLATATENQQVRHYTVSACATIRIRPTVV
jgi:hypothetical protein